MNADGCTAHSIHVRRARAACLVAALSFPAMSFGAEYLAVFVDGRILSVTAARVLDERRIRFALPGGGTMDVPLARVDRVIEAELESTPIPVVEPKCAPGFVEQSLPAGTPFRAEILAAGREHNLHPWLVAAVIDAESRFKQYAMSRVGAAGLMQLMPAVWIAQGLQNPYEPKANIRAGCKHLRALLDRFERLGLALAAYNAGAAVVESNGGIPPYRETRDYVRRVLGLFCPEGERETPGPTKRPAK